MKDIKLKLVMREAGKVYMPVEQAHKIVEAGNKAEAWRLFTSLVDAPAHHHDVDHLKMIINWTPPDGQTMMETARWVMLALTVDKVSTEKTSTLDMTAQQVEMIYEKLRNPQFKVGNIQISLFQFLAGLEEAAGEPIYVVKEKEKKDGNESKPV